MEQLWEGFPEEVMWTDACYSFADTPRVLVRTNWVHLKGPGESIIARHSRTDISQSPKKYVGQETGKHEGPSAAI